MTERDQISQSNDNIIVNNTCLLFQAQKILNSQWACHHRARNTAYTEIQKLRY